MPENENIKLRKAPPAPVISAGPCPGYAELGITTNFSFLRGASHADELIFRAAELGYRTLGVTDRNTLAGIVRAHAAAKQVSIKLLVGTRLTFSDAPDVLVWVTDRAAYARLCRLLTRGKRRAAKGECELHLADLLEFNHGLLLAVDPAEPATEACGNALRQLREAAADRLSLATSCFYNGRDAQVLRQMLLLSRAFEVPLLATNGVHYHDPSRRALQDVMTCIRHGCTIQEAGFRLFPNGERYLKSPEQMKRLLADHPQAIHQSIELADRCTFNLDELQYEYPHEVIGGEGTPFEQLARLTWECAATRYPQGIPDKVRALVERELKLIGELKIEAYFLTVYDLVRFARSRDILCQGRGSAANSAVCYCLGVTSVDPERINVLFERFVSSARNEPPDIDIDFEHERREEVIQYIYEKYGRERAGMTAEVITYRGRSAIRDVGKAMGLGLDLVEQMARKLDWWDRGTISSQRLREVGLDPDDQTVRLVVGLSGQLLGFPRHLSQHVGGMVMTRGPLCELVPIENAAMADRTVIEWDKDDIDALGILKVDVLALGMLTCIAKAIKLINDHRQTGRPELLFHTIPTEDPAVYTMASKADTIGVFQIESRAQMSMLPRLRPKEFYDLVIEVAIVRPGPIQGDMVHPYLKRRNGQEKVEYPKPELKAVLGKTLGVPLFQEQAMRIAIECAGFTPEEADRLRRAVTGFRRYGDIETFAQKFVGGMLDRGFDRSFAERCFEQLKGFASYGFPESHAASFALLVYASAWIKCHHPAAFCCALLNSQPMGFYAPAQIVRDAQDHDVEVRPVDVNHSNWDCALERDSSGRLAVRLGYRMVRGFRQAHGDRIGQSRDRHGAFQSIQRFHQITRLPESVMQRLAEADGFTSMGLSRREALWKILSRKDEQLPLFDELNLDGDEPAIALPRMPLGQEVMTDYATAGLSLKQHPMSLLREELTRKRIVTAEFVRQSSAERWVKVAGLVLIRQRPGTASGIVFMTLEDETGVVNLIVRPDIYEQYRPAARHASVLQADGYVERQGEVVHVMVKRVYDLSHMLAGYALSSRDFH